MVIIMTSLKKNELNKHDVLESLHKLEKIDYTIKRELTTKAYQAWMLECALIGMKNDLDMIYALQKVEKESDSSDKSDF